MKLRDDDEGHVISTATVHCQRMGNLFTNRGEPRGKGYLVNV
jgi:hypothetical protein